MRQGQTIEEIRWDKENTVETVCLLSKLHEAKHHINVKVDHLGTGLVGHYSDPLTPSLGVMRGF